MLRFVVLCELAVELRLLPAEAVTDILAEFRAAATGESFDEWAEFSGLLSSESAGNLREAFRTVQFRCLGCSAKIKGAELVGDSDLRCPRCHGGGFKHVSPALNELPVSEGTPPVFPPTTPDSNQIRRNRLPVLEPGQILGPWRIVRLAERGGTGTIYQAYSDVLQCFAAIKVLSPNARTDRLIQRFEQEARLQARIDHPNIVQVKDFIEYHGHALLVMAWIDGETLAEMLEERKRLDLDAVLDIGIQVCRGLAIAHENGVIHRDLKPENILIDAKTKRVKITDFGFAKAVDRDLKLTETGGIVGTPTYMPPEQIWGDIVSPAADVYSLGATLFHAATGQPPFVAQSFGELLDRHINDPFPSVADFVPGSPPAFDELLKRMCAKRPQNRPANMAQVAVALDTIRRDLKAGPRVGPTTARPVKPPLPAKTLTRSQKLAVGAIGDAPEPSESTVRVIEIIGSLDAANAAPFDALIDEQLDEGAVYFVLELSRCTAANSTGIALLIRLNDSITALGGIMVFADLHPDLQTMLEKMGIEDVFRTAPDVPDALAQIGVETAPELVFGG